MYSSSASSASAVPEDGRTSAEAVPEDVMSHSDMRRVLDDEMDTYFEARQHVWLSSGPTVAESVKTTVMVRNIDNNFAPQAAMDKLESLGILEQCDFYFMPMFTAQRNKGYFFLNFRRVPKLAELKEQLRGFAETDDSKAIEVAWATWQGLPELRRHFSRKSVTRQHNRPTYL